MLSSADSRPLRLVLLWQTCASAGAALIAAIWWGKHGALSAFSGGITVVAAGGVYVMMVAGRRIDTAAQTIHVLIRAEGMKLIVLVLLAWAVLTYYHAVIAPLFITTFIAAILIQPAALLVKNR